MKSLLTFCGILVLLAHLGRAEATWTENYDQALKDAKAQKKLLLLNFTGSDWCPVCRILDKEVYAQPEFQAYAAKKLLLVTVDFPANKLQAPAITAQNNKLAEQFGVSDMRPETVISTADGKKLGSFPGYRGGGPKAVIAKIEEISAKKN